MQPRHAVAEAQHRAGAVDHAHAERGEALDFRVLELGAVSEPGSRPQPPRRLEKIDRLQGVQPAAQFALGGARVQMRVQAAAVFRGEFGECAHQPWLVVGDVRRTEVQAQHRAGAPVVPALHVRAALREQSLLGVDERFQSRAHESGQARPDAPADGRQSGSHQVHAQAERAHRLELGGQALLSPVAEEKGVIGAGGRAREQQLGSRVARRDRDVLGAHFRPYRIEVHQPVLGSGAVHLREGAGERLEEMVVQVDESRNQQAAVQVDDPLCGERDRPGLHALDAAVQDRDVRIFQPRGRVVAGADPAGVA